MGVILRSGKVTKYHPVRSKGFNVKGRADNPLPTNILISADFNKQRLGRKYNVGVLSPDISKPATLENAADYGNQISALQKSRYVLIGYGQDYLYFGKVPLPMRGPRANPKAAKADPDFPYANGTDVLEINVCYTKPVTQGLDRPARDTVMGDSALNYAASVYGKEYAHGRKWEWLHVVGRSLGGNHEVGNLVAGTFDANTAMIPFERSIQQATQRAGRYNQVEARYIVNLYPDSWVAIDIQAMFHGCGQMTGWQTFRCQTDMAFDKLQYDIWTV